MRCWCGYLSGARCRLFAYGPADALHSKTPSSLASFKSRLVLPFWHWLTQIVQEKRPLNGCSSSSYLFIIIIIIMCVVVVVVVVMCVLEELGGETWTACLLSCDLHMYDTRC